MAVPKHLLSPRFKQYGQDAMAGFRLQLPTIQNWSCHNCGDCCRHHLIEVTEEERQRIIEQNWTESDGVPATQPILVKHGGPPWNKRYRLGHRSDGACVFLNEQGLCRIHAKFGEAAKPLPCRIYPYAFHPAGKNVTVSLRFSCPSVVSNLGNSVRSQEKEIKKMAYAVVPSRVSELPPAAIHSGQRVDWPDFMRFIHVLDQTFEGSKTPTHEKILRALSWVGLVQQSRFDTIHGERLDEFLDIIRQASIDEAQTQLQKMPEPGRTGRLLFRMLVAQYARKDTLVDRQSGLRGRWKLFRAATRFARGKGNIPPLQDSFVEVPFEQLEQPFGPLSPKVEKVLSRYFRVKIQGIHFCGRAFYDLSFVEGLYSLALIFPAILWLARWLAAGHGRTELEMDDVVQAIVSADHYHGYSPAFRRGSFRRRVKMLARQGEIAKLCVWYSR